MFSIEFLGLELIETEGNQHFLGWFTKRYFSMGSILRFYTICKDRKNGEIAQKSEVKSGSSMTRILRRTK